MRFRFIEDRRADHPVTIMYDVLGVSPAGYYAWRAYPQEGVTGGTAGTCAPLQPSPPVSVSRRHVPR
jgi:hypothetical protein